jgi:hypothetical protein
MAKPVTINWAGGEHEFLLRIGEIRALDDKCDGGAFAAWYRLRGLSPRFDDVYETVRLGLVGGGMASADAAKLVAKVEDQSGIGEMIPAATEILFRAFHRTEGEDAVGEANAGATPPSD